jgi:methionyl-tRNA synthetase
MADFLLIPAMPTPNGRMHLGHLAGPYLRLDVLARHLRRRGDRAVVLSGTDAYESYVLLRAAADGLEAEETASRWHEAIRDDFAAAGLAIDEFVNPLAPEWRGRFAAAHQSMLNALIGRGVEVREETWWMSAGERYVAGCWMISVCPDCGSGVAGYCCEECGGHFDPQHCREVTPRFGGAVVPVQRRAFHLAVPAALSATLTGYRLPNVVRRAVDATLARTGGRIRLTVPGRWGIPVEGENEMVIFTYGAAGYATLLGEICAEQYGVDPFDQRANVTIVGACGVDNGVPIAATMQAQLLASGRRAFDRIVVNQFLSLAGSKFSTSRGHAIWAGDLAAIDGVGSDGVRYAVASLAPDDAPADMSVDALARALTSGARIRSAVAAAIGELGDTTPVPDERCLDVLSSTLARQDAAMATPTIALLEVVATLRSWLELRPQSHAYWWTRGFALLAGPLMPSVSCMAWAATGLSGEPRLADLLHASPPAAHVGIDATPFDAVRLEAVLPATLSRSESAA